MNSIRTVLVSLGICTLTAYVHASSPCAPPDHHGLSQQQVPLCLDDDNAPRVPASLTLDSDTWSHKPFCVTEKTHTYCTYTTSQFRDGHGLSIIARPIAANAMSSTFPASKKAQQVSEEGLEVRSIPGKGKGLITSRPIKRGDIILLDSPRIIASAQFPSHISREQGQSLFNTTLDHLPKSDRDLVLSLDKSLGGTDIENVMKTNAFACQLNDGEVGDGYMCLFPSVARINHACRPNAHGRFIPRTLLMEIKAVRDIEAGEEISISYGKLELKHLERQRLYRNGWNFTCTCSACSASRYDISESDMNRVRFEVLRDMLENLSAETFDARQVIEWEEEIIEISAIEGLDTLLAGDYERLAYVHAGLGKVNDAKIWANQAKQSLMNWTVVDGGPQNEIERVEELLRELDGRV